MYSLPAIPYLSTRFRLIAQEPTRLPVFQGSLIRGAFGFALRHTACVMGARPLCLEITMHL